MYVLETLEIKILENNDFLGVVLMNLSKAFDRIPNDLVIAMLAAYGFDNVCQSASNQLNALIRPKYLLRFEGRMVLVNTFAMSNFN